MEFQIRPYHPSDMPSLYQICLRTADHGADATHLFRDPEICGHMFCGPYLALEPDLAFVVTADGVPCGYIIATRDSTTFRERCEREWFPPLRSRYPLPPESDQSRDAMFAHMIHGGHDTNDDLPEYPAHLHIDLLPVAQGQGLGRKLMQTLLARLSELQVPGVCLIVSKSNPGAVTFYERVGLSRLKEYDGAIAFGTLLGDRH